MFRLKLATIMTGVLMTTAQAQYYVVTNNDIPYGAPNSMTVYKAAKDGALIDLGTYSPLFTETWGIGGKGFVSINRQAITTLGEKACVFISDASGNNGASNISVYMVANGTPVWVQTYTSPKNETGVINGLGLAVKGEYLYANYTDSRTIAVWQIGYDCTLTYRNDISASGLSGGSVQGMTVSPSGKVLVTAFSDGSIGSFALSGDSISLIGRENSAGSAQGNIPAGVTTDSKGNWAIFGDSGSNPTAIDVCPISANGTLGVCTQYGGASGTLGNNNLDSAIISLSPDDTTLYTDGQLSGSAQSLAFNQNSGAVSLISACPNSGTVVMPNYNIYWQAPGVIATVTNKAKGGGIYVALSGGSSFIDVLSVDSVGCFTQLNQTYDPRAINLRSISSYPRKNP